MKRLFRKLLRLDRYRKRYQIINHFIKTRKYERYLEIGVSSGRSMARVRCACKVGVEPRPRTTAQGWTLHAQTSDEFFRENSETFDIVFIDGLHHAEQVLRDIFNSLAVLAPNGIVLLHDCHPLIEAVQFREPLPGQEHGWSGDVWKAIAYVREFVPQVYCRVLATDQGMGVVIPRNGESIPECTEETERKAAEFFSGLTWNGLVEHTAEWLGLLDGVPRLEDELRRERLCLPQV